MNLHDTVIVLRIEVPGVDPRFTDPEELAEYLIDSDADDPVPTLLSAEWAQ